MPIYEYRCNECEQIFEEWQRDHAEHTVPCPVCGAESPRIISNTSFVLKGTGWYVTDYASGRTSHGSAKTDAEGGNGNGTTPAKADSTPAAPAAPPKTEAKAPKPDAAAAQQ
ncbi:zinc ribbon domain-containing protein [Desulfocurvus sp.]|jgi:putative FmdB family regulatory protein|uniref:FmdB family zinc ribbon protein n=1 Tax=Desulfocurvus sp. TaxID=2871698 RepID=UPI0025C6F86A|nr:zinc ribbon domain-containing protein [Desulfocurvus sp.]MCK9239126.1 zinc ribbon domain-containing protein [Desulfocurvus sp.]